MFEGLHHVAVIVTNVEKSKHFYGNVIGFEESEERPDFPFPGAWYQIGSTQIHLIYHEEAKTLRGTDQIDSKDGHFAIRVNDMKALIARLEQFDIVYDSRPNSITGWHQVFVTDPDGNVIEFNAEV